MSRASVHPALLGLMRGAEAPAVQPFQLKPQDWPQLIKQAEGQRLLPWLYRYLRTHPAAAVLPARLLDSIKERAAAVTARNLNLAGELARILRECAIARVRSVPLRGLALAEQLYGDLGSRPMGDLDLLVDRDALPSVTAILKDLGFHEHDRRPGFARRFSSTLEFFKDHHGWVIVEPHWTIAYPPFTDTFDMEPVWDRCVKGRVIGIETRLLGCEDLFLHLCFHLIHRRTDAPLLWFYELDLLLRRHRQTLHWPWILESAVQSGQGALLATVFQRVTHLFDSPIPDWVMHDAERSEQAPTRQRADRLARRLTRMLTGNSRVDGLESFALFFAIKGIRRKLSYAFALAFPSAEFMRLEYGLHEQRRLGFCYLTRLVFLLREGLRGLMDLFVHRKEHQPADP